MHVDKSRGVEKASVIWRKLIRLSFSQLARLTAVFGKVAVDLLSMAKLVMLSAYEHGPGLIIWVSCVNDGKDLRYSAKPPKMKIANRAMLSPYDRNV
jgi:hypothetical protein